MFSRLFGTAQSCLRISQNQPAVSSQRLFSTTSVTEKAYKMKSHQGAKKRWRPLASGNAFKRGKAGHQHLNVGKSSVQKNRLSTTAYSNTAQTHKLKKLLLHN